VRDQNASEVRGVKSKAPEPATGLADAEAAIEQEAGSARLDHQRIPLTSAAKNGESHAAIRQRKSARALSEAAIAAMVT